MTLITSLNTKTSASYLNSRFESQKSNVDKPKSAPGFVQALNNLPAQAPAQPIVTQNEIIPFASFIDNIDFSKFKSDPLHFGKFIPIDTENKFPVSETAANSNAAENIKASENSVASLLGAIEAQLSYTSPTAPSALVYISGKNEDLQVTVKPESSESEVSTPSHNADTLSQSPELISQYLSTNDLSHGYIPNDLLNEVEQKKALES